MRRVERMIKHCAVCDKEILVRPKRFERTKYCSRQCRGRATVGHMNAVRPPVKGNFKVGDNMGKANHKWVEPIEFKCEYCGDLFYKKPYQVNHADFAGRYCSKKCRNNYRKEYESGENSPHWVGGPRTYRGRGWLDARAKAVERDNGTCQVCSMHIGYSIPVHHIIPFRDFDSAVEANALDNLVCQCQPCHMRHEPRTNHHSKPGNPG